MPEHITHTQKPGSPTVFIGRDDLKDGLARALQGPIALTNMNNTYPLD
jgi:hypothetical protein